MVLQELEMKVGGACECKMGRRGNLWKGRHERVVVEYEYGGGGSTSPWRPRLNPPQQGISSGKEDIHKLSMYLVP